MQHEPIVRKRAEAEPLAAAVARARISYAAGEGVEHRVVSEWLRTWASADSRPFKEWLAVWDG